MKHIKKIKKIYVQQTNLFGKLINLVGLSVLGFVIYSAWTSPFIKDVSTHQVNSIKNWSITKASQNPVAYIEGQLRDIDMSFSDLQQSKIELEGILMTSHSETEVFKEAINIINSENDELKILYINAEDPNELDSIRTVIESNLLMLEMHEKSIKDNSILIANLENDLDEVDSSLYELKQLSAEYQVALRSALSRDAIKTISLPDPQDLAKMQTSIKTLTMNFRKDNFANLASQKLRIQERDIKFKKFMQGTTKESLDVNPANEEVTNSSIPTS